MSILVWPHKLLTPAECRAYVNPFTRSGGRTLGGLKISTRTDLGYHTIELVNIPLYTTAQKRTFDAIGNHLGGSSGRIAVPAWSMDSAPYASGNEEPLVQATHQDGSLFSDGASYEQGAISIVSHGITALGATAMSMRIINAAADLSGLRFSYNHALYTTGQALSVDGDIWTLSITPSIRQVIPHGAELEFDRPTCVARLVEDNAMKRSINVNRLDAVSVTFEEDTDYWYRLAKGLI